MEGGDQPTSRNGAANGGARWNPTNEQIMYLEEKYRQGLRTPTAEEIQKITEDLKVHGKIEGKNVFYWFQNHKARQRQKQKQQQQQMFGFYNRVHHNHHSIMNNPPLLLPAPVHNQNVIYNNSSLPFYLAPPVKRDQSCLYPKVPLPAAPSGGGEPCKKSRPIDQYQQKNTHACTQRYNASMQEPTCKNPHVETLDLFPIHPTGILQRENNDGENKGSSSKNPNCLSGDWFDHHIGNIECTAREGHVAVIDFFACDNN